MKTPSRLLALPVLVALSLLGGCASSSRAPLPAYEGAKRPLAEVAVVVVPETIQVMAIDGREPPPSLLRRDLELALLPGEHVLSLRYVQVFQLNADEHDVVRSRQAALRFTAVAGGRYRLEAPLQSSHAAAQAFAKAPAFRLVDAGGASVESTAVKSFAEASLIDTLSKAFQDSGEPARPVTNVDLLKDVWGRSSEGERAEFLEWAGQQKR